jgi:hypothetical protein
MGGVELTAGRPRRAVRMITVLLAAVIVALLAFIPISGALSGTLALGNLWPALSLLTIVLVTGVVGLVVAGHQPRNPIGWLLAGEAVFILLSVAAGCSSSTARRRWPPPRWPPRRCSTRCGAGCS